MLISIHSGIVNASQFKKYSYGNLNLYINGVLFIRGQKAGEESLRLVAETYQKERKPAFDALCGAFVVVLEDTENDTVLLFSDNSCMQGAFISQNHIGSNLAEIIQAEGIRTFDDRVVCEYMTLVRGIYTETYVAGISSIDHTKYYLIANGRLSVIDKGISDLSGNSSIRDPEKFFADVADSLSDLQIATSLTGGYDSRLVTAFMNHSKPVDSFISGNVLESPELKASILAAKAANVKLLIFSPEKPVITDAWLEQQFIAGNGYRVAVGTSGYRVRDFHTKLELAGYELATTGNGGDLISEFWLRQDYPFYHRKKTNLQRFYTTRMEVIDYSPLLGERLSQYHARQRDAAETILSPLVKHENSLSYVSFGWRVDWIKHMLDVTESGKLVFYSPLQEIDLQRYVYHHKFNRHSNGFHRKYTTRFNRELARVRTCYGTTASDEKRDLLLDLFAQLLEEMRQAIRWMGRKVFKTTIFPTVVMDWEIESEIRRLQTSSEALAWAKQEGYVSAACDVESIPFRLLECLLNLWFTKKLFFDAQE